MIDSIALSITDRVNKEGELKLIYKKTVSDGSLLCLDDAGKRYAIVCYGGLMTPIIRSVLQEIEPGKGFRWQPDGQPGANAILVTIWPESHRHQPTTSEVVEVLDSVYPNDTWLDLVKTEAFSMPDKINLKEVIAMKEAMIELQSFLHV